MTAPPWAQLLPVFARQSRPLAPAQPVCLPSRGQWLVAPLVRALRVPSHFGLLAASLSFVAEPTSFAAQPKAPAAARTLAGWGPPLPPLDVSAWRSQTWFSARVARPTPHCAPLQPDPRS